MYRFSDGAIKKILEKIRQRGEVQDIGEIQNIEIEDTGEVVKVKGTIFNGDKQVHGVILHMSKSQPTKTEAQDNV